MKFWYIKNGTVALQPTSPQDELPAGVDAGIALVEVANGRIRLWVVFSNGTDLTFEFDASVSTLIQDIETSIQYHTDLL